MADIGNWFIGGAVLFAIGAVVYVKTVGVGLKAGEPVSMQTKGHVNILQSGEVVPYSVQVKAAQTTAQAREYVNVCGMENVICF